MSATVIGFVGAGRVVQENYLGALAQAGIRALLYDLDPARSEGLAAWPFVRAVARLDALDQADLIVVATPAGTHASIGRRLLAETGTRVLLEKPPVTCPDDLAVLQRADRSSRVSTAWIRRAFPATATAQTWLRALVGQAGPVQSVEIWEGTVHSWRSRGATAGVAGLDPLLWDELSHPLDLAFHVLGAGRWKVAETVTSRCDQLAVEASSNLVGPEGDLRFVVHASREETFAGVIRFRGPFGILTLHSGLNGWVRFRSPEGSVHVRRPPQAGRLDEIILGSLGLRQGSAAVGCLQEWVAPLGVAASIGTSG